MHSKSKSLLICAGVLVCLLGVAGCSAATPLPAKTLPPSEESTLVPQASDTLVETITSPPTSLPLALTDTPEPSMATAAPATNPPGTSAPASSWKGIPILADATEPIEDGNTYSYTTASSVAEVTDYYTKELTNLGWELFSSEKGETISETLVFEKGTQALTIALARHPIETDHTLVVIVVQ